MHSIAVPLNADPIKAIRADPELWETATVNPPFAPPWPGEPLPDINRALLTVMPAGDQWVSHFGDRSHEQAEYLLDPAAYRTQLTWEESKTTPAFYFLNGREPFADHARSGQGIPWRYSTRAYLADAIERFDRLDLDAVRREFSVAEMADLGVYKVHREEDDNHAFQRVLAELRAFADHCRTVVAQNLDMIITLE